MAHDRNADKPARSHLRTIAVAGFFVVAAALLSSEHRVHALGFPPYLLLLACPLLHLMHGGHRHRDALSQCGIQKQHEEYMGRVPAFFAKFGSREESSAR